MRLVGAPPTLCSETRTVNVNEHNQPKLQEAVKTFLDVFDNWNRRQASNQELGRAAARLRAIFSMQETDGDTVREPLDTSTIATGEPHEVNWWCRQLNCTRVELMIAVNAVGANAKKVEAFLSNP